MLETKPLSFSEAEVKVILHKVHNYFPDKPPTEEEGVKMFFTLIGKQIVGKEITQALIESSTNFKEVVEKLSAVLKESEDCLFLDNLLINIGLNFMVQIGRSNMPLIEEREVFEAFFMIAKEFEKFDAENSNTPTIH
jgi:hypothetical protein